MIQRRLLEGPRTLFSSYFVSTRIEARMTENDRTVTVRVLVRSHERSVGEHDLKFCEARHEHGLHLLTVEKALTKHIIRRQPKRRRERRMSRSLDVTPCRRHRRRIPTHNKLSRLPGRTI